jgi:DNA uptake protein ComE-like DNA-binding protein
LRDNGVARRKKMARLERVLQHLSLRSCAALAAGIVFAGLTACNTNVPQSDQQLKQQAAQTTEQVKQGAQQAAADAKVAAANAERKVNDIAAGVKQGMQSNTTSSAGVTPSGAVDINSASTAQLTSLPGISDTRAQRIVDARPYSSPHDLVAKGLISEAEYSRISGRIVAD